MLVSDNERIGGSINGRLVLSRKYRERKQALHLHLLAQAKRNGHRPLTGKVAVVGDVYYPDNRRRDMSMFVKILHDCLQDVAYADDVQIHYYSYCRMPNDKASPRVEVEVNLM